MRPFYDARAEDIGPRDLIRAECRCGHVEMLTAATLATARVLAHERVAGLSRRLRCRRCDAKGQATVSIVWAR